MEENMVNPYQSPLENLSKEGMVVAELVSTRPPYKLYAIQSIVIATFLGAPVGGGILMAINYKRLGFPGKAAHAIVWSAVATAILVTIGMLIPDDVPIPTIAYALPQLLGMYAIATSLQDQAIKRHQSKGGSLASSWAAAGIGLLCLIAVLAVVFIVSFAIEVMYPS